MWCGQHITHRECNVSVCMCVCVTNICVNLAYLPNELQLIDSRSRNFMRKHLQQKREGEKVKITINSSCLRNLPLTQRRRHTQPPHVSVGVSLSTLSWQFIFNCDTFQSASKRKKKSEVEKCTKIKSKLIAEMLRSRQRRRRRRN